MAYEVRLSNCGGKTMVDANIHSVDEKYIGTVVNTATKAFRSVEVYDEETGEIATNIYISDKWFDPLLSKGEALDFIEAVINGEMDFYEEVDF